MVVGQLPPDVCLWIRELTQPLHAQVAGRLLPLVLGVLFGRGRRTVASWLRAAGLGHDFAA